jgi:uncharacterized protein (TIGR02246 family)
MQRFLSAVSAGILLGAAGMVLAQDREPAGQRPIQEVRKLLTEMEKSFGRGDAKGLAACWTAGGDFTGISGERIEGRQNIERMFQGFLATRKDSKLKLHLASLRVASEDLVLLEATSEVKPETTEGGGEDVLVLVIVKRDGRWLIESARETAASAPSPAQRLKDLEWLVGEWSDEVSPQHGRFRAKHLQLDSQQCLLDP